MAYSQKLRELFPDITLQAEDLLLLESFQINYLPDRVVKKEFTALLRKYAVVHRFLVNKHPPIESFLSDLLEENAPVSNPDKIEEYCQEALWEIADLIIYNKHPDLIDSMGRIRWDIEEITAITPLEGKAVADVGAGSGRIAFLVAPFAQTVYAVEPITSFRSFMKEKAVKHGTKNLYVMDGTLDSIPLPADSLDVLITSNAIGWNLSEELKEIERVIKPGGSAIHLLYTEQQQENPYHEVLTSAPWFYGDIQKGSESTLKIIYHKTIDISVT
jgi:ubiquinone/menaquinone biosynthesis C-methylase UbiE